MSRVVLLDESGDLGWNFILPFRKGGSSRYLTIGYCVCPESKKHIPARLVIDFYKKYGIKPANEKKGKDLSPAQKILVAEETVKMVNSNPDFRIGAITVKKENVNPHIRTDGNKLYNYMIKRSVLDRISTFDKVKLIRDERTIKVESGNSCIDYLQITLWFDYGVGTLIFDHPGASHKDNNLIFVDWITNIVWSNYEDNKPEPFTKLSAVLTNQTLFF